MQSRWGAGLVGALVTTGLSVSAPAHAVAPPTSTSLLLSGTRTAYGQTVTATATVVATSGLPEGDVVFSADNRQFKANLGASGSVTVVLPDALVGSHQVTATYVPQFPDAQEPSSASEVWTVVPVRTRLQVRVIGKGARIPTSVQVKAAGEYGTLASGRVTMEVRHVRSGATTRAARRLSPTGVALADLGRLRKGAYRLVVTYSGDTQHLLERRFVRFRVRRR
jgi:hypothetical protein